MKLHERLKAIMECKLDSTARMVLVVIADAMATDDVDRPVWRSAATIAERAGISRATAIDTLKRLEAAGVVTSDERTNGDSVRRRIDWRALAAAERPTTKRGSNPTTRNGGVRTSDRSEDLTPLSEDLTGGESEHLTPRGSEDLTGESEDLTGGVRTSDPIRPTPSSDPPIDDPSTAKNARPMPAAVDLSAVPLPLHDGMRRILARAAAEGRRPQTAETAARWADCDLLRGQALLHHLRQMPHNPEVSHADSPTAQGQPASKDPDGPQDRPRIDAAAPQHHPGRLGVDPKPRLNEVPHASEVPKPSAPNGPSSQAAGAASPAGDSSPRVVGAVGVVAHQGGSRQDPPAAPRTSLLTEVSHAQISQQTPTHIPPAQSRPPSVDAGVPPSHSGADDADAIGAGAPPRTPPIHLPGNSVRLQAATRAGINPMAPGSRTGDGAPSGGVSGAPARGGVEAGGNASGLVADPDLGARRVSAPRWDESPAWHEAAGLYVDISAALLPEARPAYVVPSDPAGRDIGRGLEALGGRYVRRLAAILAALRRELAPAAAHEVARLARDLWAQENPAGALATIRKPRPAPKVADVDTAIAEDVPWVEPPPPKGTKAGRESPLDRYLRECAQEVLDAK